MSNQEKFNTLEALATKLLKDILIEKSPIFTKAFEFGSSENWLVAQYLGTNGKISLYDAGWRFSWNRGKRRVGMCSYEDKTIELSSRYVANNNNDVSIFTDTILHEIAHALTPGHNHDNVWKQACVIVGANPSRLCDDPRIVGTNSHLALWTAKCANCGVVHKRHRKPKYINSLICANTHLCKVNKTPLLWKERSDFENSSN